MKGLIFDIQRFGLHDGPGIRTVYFLKGCPMKCAWCCNPESQDGFPQLLFVDSKCINCMKCIDSCKFYSLSESKGKLNVNFENCNQCGKCIPECPTGALKIIGYEMDVEAILKDAMKDFDYYRNSGGGVTLTGGEPLFQPEFCFEILSELKKAGIHTCIETAGAPEQRYYEKILPVTDLIFFGYKVTNEEDHIKWTGVSKKQILENLEFLYSKGANIIIRCPIIPGINDSASHFQAIADLEKKYPNLSAIEIEPYHDYGSSKYAQIGKEYSLNNKSVENDTVQSWLNVFKELGCKKIRRS